MFGSHQNNYALKLNQSAHAAWNSTNANTSSQTTTVPLTHGTSFSTTTPAASGQQQNGTHTANPSPAVPLGGSYQHQNSNALGPFGANGLLESLENQNNPTGAGAGVGAAGANSTQNPNSLPGSTTHLQQHPQTPAQQVLMSAADRWGLLGLLQMIKNVGADLDHGLSGIGTDLGTMGLDMGYPGCVHEFVSVWLRS